VNLRAQLLVLKYATVGIGNHDGFIRLQAVINRLRVRNIHPLRTNIGLVLTQSYCQTRLYLGQEHSTQWAGSCNFSSQYSPNVMRMDDVFANILYSHGRCNSSKMDFVWRANCYSLNGYLFNETLLWSKCKSE